MGAKAIVFRGMRDIEREVLRKSGFLYLCRHSPPTGSRESGGPLE
jgi:hypothetical protein